MASYVYLLHLNNSTAPGTSTWLEPVHSTIEASYPNLDLICHPYDEQCGFSANDVYSLWCERRGPILLASQPSKPALRKLRDKLQRRTPIKVIDITTHEALLEEISLVLEAFERGEPLLPTKLVVALCVMQKLEKTHMWGGNAKSYEWADNIANGRGVDPDLKAEVRNVLEDLLANNYLITKRSQSKKKYALNPEIRPIIYEVLESGEFPEGRIRDILMRSQGSLPASRLDRFFATEPQLPSR